MSGSKLSDASSFRPNNGRPEDHPLGLTVHNLPTPQEALDGARRRTVVGRWKMLAVLLTCAAPVIASYFTYYVVRPQGRGNFGELIEPQRPLPDQAVVALDGQPGNLRGLKGQWLLVSAGGGACDAICQKHLYLQRQLRETLGKEKDRVDWVWLVTDDAPIPEALRPALKGATVLRVGELQLSQWLSPAVGHLLQEHLYVVDPMGNWMMRFPAGLDLEAASKAKRDMDRLLRASASWDEAGR
ncbi:SCO family protein [Rhodoferax sp. WC2427]|uniref:SCO family protein n=1 Tax=Rhodoferax sp. WC2427 TaxID=3234144 RepID=UPI003467910D